MIGWHPWCAVAWPPMRDYIHSFVGKGEATPLGCSTTQNSVPECEFVGIFFRRVDPLGDVWLWIGDAGLRPIFICSKCSKYNSSTACCFSELILLQTRKHCDGPLLGHCWWIFCVHGVMVNIHMAWIWGWNYRIDPNYGDDVCLK